MQNLGLIENKLTNKPAVNALLSLMCFHSSRFEARTNEKGETVLYQDQDTGLWNMELVRKGEYFLNKASEGDKISKYHFEAGIGYWHTIKDDTNEKWENILQLYNRLLQLEYSPMAALNRTYALAKSNGNAAAIIEAEKLGLQGNCLYHSLLGNLYMGIDSKKAIQHFETALGLAKSNGDKTLFQNKISMCRNGCCD